MDDALAREIVSELRLITDELVMIRHEIRKLQPSGIRLARRVTSAFIWAGVILMIVLLSLFLWSKPWKGVNHGQKVAINSTSGSVAHGVRAR
jgi:hypothetical protein